jgi:hypothetical protein
MMLLEVDAERRQALIELLAIPDDPTLRRGHHLTIEGRSDRFALARSLAATFVQWHQIQREERGSESVLHA